MADLSPAPHLQVRRFVTISTGHLSFASHHWMDAEGVKAAAREPHALWMASMQYGWFLYTGYDGGEFEDGVPDDVVALVRWAKRHGFDFVLLDCDAELVKGLPTYDHETPLPAPVAVVPPADPDSELARVRAAAKVYDDRMNDTLNDGANAEPPDGDDYNELYQIVMGGWKPDTVREAASDLLKALPTDDLFDLIRAGLRPDAGIVFHRLEHVALACRQARAKAEGWANG
jgi:hypothetical protein